MRIKQKPSISYTVKGDNKGCNQILLYWVNGIMHISEEGSKHKVHINKATFQAFTVVTLAHSHTLAVGPAESGWVAVHGLVGTGYRQALHCTKEFL